MVDKLLSLNSILEETTGFRLKILIIFCVERSQYQLIFLFVYCISERVSVLEGNINRIADILSSDDAILRNVCITWHCKLLQFISH